MTERQGIEIDYCPQCRGVWLDRGELDKIIERSEASAVAPVATQPLNDRRNYEQPRSADSQYRHEPRHDNQGHHHKKHKKENFLGDLFDF